MDLQHSLLPWAMAEFLFLLNHLMFELAARIAVNIF